MSRILFILIILIAISCSSKKNIKYFDDTKREISKEEFYKIQRENHVFIIEGDSLHHKMIIKRRVEGIVQNRSILNRTLNELTKTNIDTLKPLVIIYNPGNFSIKNDTKSEKFVRHDDTFIKHWKKDLYYGVGKLIQTKPIFIFKTKEGFDPYNGLIKWHKDPNGVIERLFFKRDYRSSSFVVINKDGNFISYFGEFHIDQIWQAIQELYP